MTEPIYGQCAKCGGTLYIGHDCSYHPKTPLGEKLMALREKAIAEGMVTLSADEILAITWTTSCPCPALPEDMVIVKVDDLIALGNASDWDCDEDLYWRIKHILEKKT